MIRRRPSLSLLAATLPACLLGAAACGSEAASDDTSPSTTEADVVNPGTPDPTSSLGGVSPATSDPGSTPAQSSVSPLLQPLAPTDNSAAVSPSEAPSTPDTTTADPTSVEPDAAMDTSVDPAEVPDTTADGSSTTVSPESVAPEPAVPDNDPGVAPAAVSELTVEANPNNVLSAYVSWTTDVAANSEVHFGQGAYQFKIVDAALVTEHRVLVIGMHAQSDYLIKALSSNSAGSAEGETTFTSGTLPQAVPEPTLLVKDESKSQPGWTLTNIQTGSNNPSPAVLVMYDHDGVPVWYHINGSTTDSRGDISVDLLENNNVLVGPASGESAREIDLGGNVVWEGPPQVGGGGGFGGGGGGGGGEAGEPMTHHAGKLPDGNYVTIRGDGDIEEVTPDGESVWSWHLLDHVTNNSGTTGDWCHGNSVTIDKANDAVYLNCRWLGLIKTTYNDPTLLWHLPASYGASDMGNMAFVPETAQFSDAHDPEIHEDGTILLYDNGGYAGGGGFGGGGGMGQANDFHSRVQEYRIDETTLEATLIWEFPGDFQVDSWFTEDWYNPFWGDADRQPNGNILITAGVRGSGTTSHAFEVTREGEVVWHISYPENNGTYRSQRTVPPLVTPL